MAVLLALMRQLQEVMRAENGLLRDLKLARLRELQTRRRPWPATTSWSCAGCASRPTPSRASATERRRLLESSMREFQATVRSNADRLLQARSVVEAVVQAIGHSLGSAAGPCARLCRRPAGRGRLRRRG